MTRGQAVGLKADVEAADTPDAGAVGAAGLGRARAVGRPWARPRLCSPSVRLVVRVAVPPPPRHHSGPGSPGRPDAAPGAWSPTTSTSDVYLDSWRHQPVAAGGDSWPLDTRFVTDPSFAAGVLDSWQGRMIEVSE